MARQKECHFFAAPEMPQAFTGPGDNGLNARFIRDPHKYASLFHLVEEHKAVGEASVFYLCYPGTAQRIAATLPHARILIVLRNPVERAYSAYMLLRRDGREPSSFREGLSLAAERRRSGYEPMWWYQDLGMYAAQVKTYLGVFGPQQVKILWYEDFVRDPGAVMREAFEFLGVREDWPIDSTVRENPGGIAKSPLAQRAINFVLRPTRLERIGRSIVPERTRNRWARALVARMTFQEPPEPAIQDCLADYFREDIGRLEELVGVKLLNGKWRMSSN
jgi:hypothetical protein